MEIPTKAISVNLSRHGLRRDSRALDTKIWTWSKGKNLTKREIQAFAIQVFTEAGHKSFKASDGWYRRWMNRWKNLDTEDSSDCQINIQEPIPVNKDCVPKTDPLDVLPVPDFGMVDIPPSPLGSDPFERCGDSSPPEFDDLLSPTSDFIVGDMGGDIFRDSLDGCYGPFIKDPDSAADFCLDLSDYSMMDDESFETTTATDDAQTEGQRSTVSKKKGERYLPQFKNKVAAFAMECSIKEAASRFNVNKGTVSDWIRDRNKCRRSLAEDKVISRPDIELIEWLKGLREKNQDVTRNLLAEKVKTLTQSCTNDEASNKKLYWLFLYAKRLEEGSNGIKNHIMYPEKFKQEIALHAIKCSNKIASKIFNIARKRIHEWIQSLNSLGGEEKVYNRDVSRYVTDDKIDKEIWEWYKSQATKPTSKQIREKATALYRSGGFTKITCSPGWYYRWRARYALPSSTADKMAGDLQLLGWVLSEFDKNKPVSHAALLNQALKLKGSNFKASSSWAVRFSKRYAPLLQSVPDLTTPLPATLEKKVQMFRKQVMNVYSQNSLQPEDLIALDEIPLNFVSSGTVKRESLLRKSGFKNCLASLIVSCSADGSLLPTVLILKSNVDCFVSYEYPEILTLEQDRGISDESTMQEWMNRIFLARCAERRYSIVMCDVYRPHVSLKSACKNLPEPRPFDIMLIPGGCTSKLQPILSRLANLFKSSIEAYWNQWQYETLCTSGSGGPVKFPDNADILKWVAQSHRAIANSEKALIVQSFRDCGYLVDAVSDVADMTDS